MAVMAVVLLLLVASGSGERRAGASFALQRAEGSTPGLLRASVALGRMAVGFRIHWNDRD